jgi:hypothetical protein
MIDVTVYNLKEKCQICLKKNEKLDNEKKNCKIWENT